MKKRKKNNHKTNCKSVYQSDENNVDLVQQGKKQSGSFFCQQGQNKYLFSEY